MPTGGIMTMDDIADPSGMDDIPVSGDQLDEAQPAPQLFKMQDLMQAIAGQSDLKRSDLREAAGLICDALGAALDDGHAISLPGLGKITPRKRDSKPSGDLLTARIKLIRKGEKAGLEPEADSA